MNILSNLDSHLRDIAESRSPRFAFYRALHIINRRIKLPKACFIGQELLSDELFLMKYLIRFEDIIFLDIGAKTGVWSKLLAPICSEIHAFEPNPEAGSLLRKNTRKLKNFHLHSCALGDKNETKAFLIHNKLENCGFINRQSEYVDTIKVPVRTIDSFNFDTVDLIKVDTEGYELPILKGGADTIERHNPQLFIEIHLDEHKAPIYEMLQAWGYTYSTYNIQRSHIQPFIITDPRRD